VSATSSDGIRFYPDELRDLAVAWVALGVAFAVFILDPPVSPALLTDLTSTAFFRVLLVSMLTVGVGFLLHELAHKVVAVRFDQVAEFRADYGMLVLAVGAGLAGFLFAAPGAVYHSGYITERENGLIAIAGPLTNVALAALFLPLLLVPGLEQVGQLGVTINLLLGAFNMIPFGPLDGRKVLSWSKVVFGVTFVGCAGLAAGAFLYVGTGF